MYILTEILRNFCYVFVNTFTDQINKNITYEMLSFRKVFAAGRPAS